MLSAPSGKSTTVRGLGRARTASSSQTGTARLLTGITLEVVEGAMDGTVLTGDFPSVRIGRNAGNDLELHSDRSVSGDHALLKRTGDPLALLLEDLHSTNGTCADDLDLRTAGPYTIPLESYFMVGNTVIRCEAATSEETYAPDHAYLARELGRLAHAFTPEVAEGYGAAVSLAAAELRPYLSDRHFFLGLVAMNPGLPILARNRGPLQNRFLAETLRRNERWTGPQAWIDKRLRSAFEFVALFKDDIVPTPRLVRLLQAAEEEARRAGSALLRAVDVLRAFVATPSSRPSELLAREGIAPESLLSLLDAAAPPASIVVETGRGKAGPREEATPHASPASPATPGPAAVVPGTGPLPPPVSSGSAVVDARAQEAARGLFGVASLYQLAAAEDRRQAMRQFLVQEIAQVTAAERPQLLAHVGRMFPVANDGGPAVALLPKERTNPRLDVVGAAVAAAPAAVPEPVPAAANIPWPLILEGVREADLSGVSPQDRAPLVFVTDILSFAMALERFITSMVQTLKSPGLGTETFQLPGHRTSIRHFAREIGKGKAPQLDALNEYLGALETWLISAIAGYHEGPELWFKDFWKKVSPQAIESRTEDDWKKRIGLGVEAKYWAYYKEHVRTLSPDLIYDEILQKVRRRADEQFQQLFEKRRRRS